MSTYKDLKSYQNAVIIHDFTVEFIKRYIPANSRTRDQMEQAARSGKQNIAEATSSSPPEADPPWAEKHHKKPKSEPMLLGVASASLKELLEDYQDYLRQHGSTSLTTGGLKQWDKSDSRALRVRGLYRSDRSDGSNMSDTSDMTYKSYQTYLLNAEDACNAMICLINQTTYLLDNQIRAVERHQREAGIIFESRNARAYSALAATAKRERKIDEIIKETLKLL